MALWSLQDAGQNAMGGQNTATSLLTAVTANATVNTPGGWVQMHVGDIAIGGNLPFACWHIPITVGLGSRIAVRTRSAVASKSCTMGVSLYGGGSGVESGYK